MQPRPPLRRERLHSDWFRVNLEKNVHKTTDYFVPVYEFTDLWKAGGGTNRVVRGFRRATELLLWDRDDNWCFKPHIPFITQLHTTVQWNPHPSWEKSLGNWIKKVSHIWCLQIFWISLISFYFRLSNCFFFQILGRKLYTKKFAKRTSKSSQRILW